MAEKPWISKLLASKRGSLREICLSIRTEPFDFESENPGFESPIED